MTSRYFFLSLFALATVSISGVSPAANAMGDERRATPPAAVHTAIVQAQPTVAAKTTFHLNYKPKKDWNMCSARDYVIFDMFDTSAADIAKCNNMGAQVICYFSSQYEDWRPDAKKFGKLGKKLGDWKGERWISPTDARNVSLMQSRVNLAKSKGCKGVDLDNIDKSSHKNYIRNIFAYAKQQGLLVSQKNAAENIDYFAPYVDMYQNEECQEYEECEAYQTVSKPVFNIEYKKKTCRQRPYMFSVVKDVEKMDAKEYVCK